MRPIVTFALVAVVMVLGVPYLDSVGSEPQIHTLERVIFRDVAPDEPAWDEISNSWLLEFGNGSGTAWPVDCIDTGRGFYEIRFVTAGHCVDHASPFQASGPEGGWAAGPAGSFRRHSELDLAVVTLYSQRPVAVRRLATEMPSTGDKLYLSSYPTGTGPFITEGYYSGDNRSTAQGYPGSSGGPVSLADGSVVGILVSGRGNGFDFVTFATYLVLLPDLHEWIYADA
jgi:hypothetical protein